MKVRTEARHDAILEIAAQVFLEKGFERASMSEIAQRVGGSKATLYGYFPSKEALFLAVTHAEGEKHMQAALCEISAQSTDALLPALIRFSETLMTFLASDAACATYRMVIAEAGRSDIGQRFYETGPKRGMMAIAEILQAAMNRGELRHADPLIAAQHFDGLIGAEIQYRWFYRDSPPLAPATVRQMAERAVEVFCAGSRLDPLRLRIGGRQCARLPDSLTQPLARNPGDLV